MDFGEIENLDFVSVYPIFRCLQIYNARNIQIVEVVEELKFSEDFVYCPNTKTIMVANRTPFSDPGESDILVKTMFSDRYFPELGVKYQDDKRNMQSYLTFATFKTVD